MSDTEEVQELRQWVEDLQAGTYINCVYCGHRYGPDDEVPAARADVLKEHIEQCPEHPMSKLLTENSKLCDEYLKGIGYIAGGGILIASSSIAVWMISGVHVMHPFFAIAVLIVSSGFYCLSRLIRRHNKNPATNGNDR